MGDATYAKNQSSTELALPVVMIQRPSNASGERVTDVEEAASMVRTTPLKSVRQVETHRAWLDGMKVHICYPVYGFAWQA